MCCVMVLLLEMDSGESTRRWWVALEVVVEVETARVSQRVFELLSCTSHIQQTKSVFLQQEDGVKGIQRTPYSKVTVDLPFASTSCTTDNEDDDDDGVIRGRDISFGSSKSMLGREYCISEAAGWASREDAMGTMASVAEATFAG